MKNKKEIKKVHPKKQILSSYKEFENLCRKYPNIKFVGNTTFNLTTMKKGTWIFNSKYPKKSLLKGKEGFVIIRNRFEGKFNEKGKT